MPYQASQLRGKKGGLFQRLGRGSTDARNALRPPEPRAAELIYRSWVRSFWKLWVHVVRTELASTQSDTAPQLAERMYALLNASGLNGVLVRTGRAVTDNVARYMGSIFKRGQAPEGVRLDAVDPRRIPRLRPFDAEQTAQIDKWRLENLRLIKNATDEHVAALFKIFKEAQEQGIAHGELAGQVAAALDVGYNRAVLIASDQTTKFNGTIQQVQQTAAGITEFIWSTSHDGAVRPTHRLLDGKKFQWSVGAPDGVNLVLPGEPIRCRCQAIPVIELFAGIDD
jgi:SPP1 gp7 family putative phage head morphogenesis protein